MFIKTRVVHEDELEVTIGDGNKTVGQLVDEALYNLFTHGSDDGGRPESLELTWDRQEVHAIHRTINNPRKGTSHAKKATSSR